MMQHTIERHEHRGGDFLRGKTIDVADSRARCSASDVLRWIGLGSEVDEHTDAMWFPMRRIHGGALLLCEGAPFERLYVVGVGTFKAYHTDDDGFDLVQGFAMRGDVIGLDAIDRGICGASVVALEDSMVAILSYRDLLAESRTVPALEKLLVHAASRELRQRDRTLQLMAAVGAEVRVARFLLEMTNRQSSLGYSSRRIRLRMSRRDIASHLGVAHETVSRSLSALADWGYIKVQQRELEICDRDGLEAYQRATRGGSNRVAAPAHAGHGLLAPHADRHTSAQAMPIAA